MASKPHAMTGKILDLPVGKTCVVNSLGPLRYARRQHPDRKWSTRAVDGSYVVTTDELGRSVMSKAVSPGKLETLAVGLVVPFAVWWALASERFERPEPNYELIAALVVNLALWGVPVALLAWWLA